jgi:ubiquinone/menaquinone biosynthesis C-methylase UbiE
MGNMGYSRNTGIAARGREYFFSRVIDNFYMESNGEGILDIGSGSGDFLVHAASRLMRVRGIEPNKDLFLIASKRVDQGTIENCGLETFFTDKKFDMIF